MLGMFQLLPLLKGWGYRRRAWTRELNNGQTLEVERVDELGWLFYVGIITNDAYGGAFLAGQGADMDLMTLGSIDPQTMHDSGSFMPDAGGYLELYNRPNPNSTAGLYFLSQYEGGFYGSLLPYVPSTIIRLYLKTNSTQAKATVSLGTVNVIITDKKAFIRSLRSVIGASTILDIDPALLTPGPAELTKKGASEK